MSVLKISRKVVLLIALLLILCLIISVFFAFGSSTSPFGGFTVPCQIKTYGAAWDGTLAFGLFDNFSVNKLSSDRSYLVVMKTNGQLVDLRQTNDASYWAVKQLSQDELLFQGEPGAWIGTHIWNLKSNKTTDLPDFGGHHDIEYNPETGTFLTLVSYERDIKGTSVLYDKIVEYNSNGTILWSWDTYPNFTVDMACQFNDTWFYHGQWLQDLTHTNSLQWDYKQNVIYLNIRDLNTFCKINKTSGELMWSCGEHGDFTLLNQLNQTVSSLWYHSHALKEVEPNVFEMFDNDFHNQTDPLSTSSRLIDVTVNESNKTAYLSWSWTAPKEFWTPYWGEVDRLPNGDRMGTFGSQTHSIFWNNLTQSNGAVLVEVNPKDEIVRTYTFPETWGIYRAIELKTSPDPSNISVPLIIVGIAVIVILTSVVGVTLNKLHSKKSQRLPKN
jgi:hypothetical protein